MFNPDQITALQDMASQITAPVVDFLIEDIAKRISEAGQLTSIAAYQIWIAQQQGVSQKEVKKKLQKLLNKSATEIEELLTQAAEVGYDFNISRFPTADAIPFAQNTSLLQVVKAAAAVTEGELRNFTRTAGFVCPDGKARTLTDAYKNACDFAFNKVITGAQDYQSAIREATKGLAEKGIVQIDYKSGRHNTVETAVRRSVLGGISLCAEEVNRQNFDLLGCDGYETSAHAGSAPDHEPHQGRQFSKAEFEKLQAMLVRPIGALQFGCGHEAFGIILGVNDPQYTAEELEEFREKNEEGITYEGKHYTLYEATQRQGKLETAIRNRKRRILIDEQLGDKDALQTDQIRLQVLKQEYNRFSKAAGLPMQYERMEAAGFDWRKGKAAENVFESMSASTKEINKIFGADSSKDLQKAVNRSTIKLQNGFACFPDGDPLNDNSQNVKPVEGFFDVGMHGTPNCVFFRSKNENQMSARTLATVIRHSKEYTGQNIRLLCCNTGKQVGDAYCFAEELANALGVTVTAPNKALYIFPDGTLRVGRSGDGSFVNYKPNQRRRLK